jgi:hypothetical protein
MTMYAETTRLDNDQSITRETKASIAIIKYMMN